jgi:hypothetical protein
MLWQPFWRGVALRLFFSGPSNRGKLMAVAQDETGVTR